LDVFKNSSKLKYKEINIEEIFEHVDTDNSGFIDFNEFIAATMDRK